MPYLDSSAEPSGRIWAGLEPPLAELVNEPIVRMLMKRDGVTLWELCQVMQTHERSGR